MVHSALARLIQIVNIVIAGLLVVLLFAIWWYAYRPLPKTSGAVRAPVTASASVARDSLGVPHIRAASQDDVFFVQGYATAQDRLFQMDGLRRSAAGALAEV